MLNSAESCAHASSALAGAGRPTTLADTGERKLSLGTREVPITAERWGSLPWAPVVVDGDMVQYAGDRSLHTSPIFAVLRPAVTAATAAPAPAPTPAQSLPPPPPRGSSAPLTRPWPARACGMLALLWLQTAGLLFRLRRYRLHHGWCGR
jgi:hypothetical protein